MESWSYVSGRKEPVSNETISSSDGFARSKNIIGGYDLKAPFGNFDNNILVSGQQAIDRQAFGELGYQELIGKQSTDNSVSIDLFTPNPNSFSLENESNSMHSSSVADCNVKGSSFIDLKLGRFGDLRDTQYYSRISKGTTILSSSDSSTPAKRSRVGVNSLIAYCQVYGCNKDLSSSKEYHKRHKVCEVHSKTAKVIVNGIEQRFCQQCSRFHLLAEFDDGKRSCRKRLAGHNERRRKPHVGILSGRSGKMLHSFNGFSGGSFPGTPFATSFICQDILPNNLLYPSKYRTNDWCRHVKVEDTNDIGPLSAIPVSRSTFGESTIRYPLDLGGSNSSSCTFLQDTSLGNRDFSVLDAASTIQQFSGITDSSGSALSLLSSQSRNSMSHSAGIPMARSHVVPGSNTYYGMSPVSNKHVGVGSRTFTSGVPNRFSSSEMSSTEETQLGPVMMPHSEATNFDITVGAYQRGHWLSAKHGLSCEDGSTIDLLQLSSQLQQVERQKQSMPVMQENDSYSFFRSRFT